MLPEDVFPSMKLLVEIEERLKKTGKVL